MHLNCELLFRAHAIDRFDGADVLEIGPNAIPSAFETISAAKSWDNADIAEFTTHGDRVQHQMPDEYTLPVDDCAYDVVFSTDVAEHVRAPWRWLAELARVTRPGGYVVSINPTSWPFHEEPVDCWRIYPDGWRALCEEVGLEVETAVCDALEPRRSRRSYPGTGVQRIHELGWKVRIAAAVGWPMPVAYDTICVARK